MTYEKRVVTETSDDPTVVAPGERVVATDDPVVTSGDPVVGRTRSEVVTGSTVMTPSGGELARRAVYLVFGIIQILIVLRILLLLLDAREGNGLVRFILDASQVFVAPFIGIFNTDALKTGGSTFDVAAVAALVGWTVLEWIFLWAVNLFRRETVV
jgi:hypothetical protein